MEDTLGDETNYRKRSLEKRLNPCFNGRYSRSQNKNIFHKKQEMVLILVLMEDTLGEY